MKTKKEIEIQLKTSKTRRANLTLHGIPENAVIIFKLNIKIDALRWVLGIVE